VSLGVMAAPKLYAARAVEWLSRVEQEHDNVRTALAWLLEHDAEGAARRAAAVRNFWLVRGHLTEGRRWLVAARDRLGEGSHERSKVLDGIGKLAWRQGDLAAARAAFREGLAIAEARGDLCSIGWLSYSLGNVSQHESELDAARAHLERSLEVGRRIDRYSMITHPLAALGV
jgi:tetratricopeptide (TPR) repeat protein